MADRITEMQEWMQDHIRQNIERSHAASHEAYKPYQGEVFAPVNQFERRASRLAGQTGSQRPFVKRAEQSARRGAREFPGQYQRYMNPYQEGVVNRIAQLGNRNLTENILPQLEAKFVRLGQHGGSRHREWAGRAARDIQSEISARQSEALAHGYGQAMTGFNADQARLMELAKHQQELGSMTTAARLAELADLRQQAALQRGLAERPLARAEMLHREQQNYPWKQRAAHTATLFGIPEYAAPYDQPQSFHRRDWQGIGHQMAAAGLSNVFGGI